MSQRPPFPLLSGFFREREPVVKGAPQFGAAERTLDHRLPFPIIDRAGKGGRTVNPGLRVFRLRLPPPSPRWPECESRTAFRICPPPADRPPACELPPESPDCGCCRA